MSVLFLSDKVWFFKSYSNINQITVNIFFKDKTNGALDSLTKLCDVEPSVCEDTQKNVTENVSENDSK